jgi:hypothetical protein
VVIRGNRKLVNIYIDAELWSKAKADAAIMETTLQVWLEQAIQYRLRGKVYRVEK